jgi:hypothetical protein
LHPSRRMRNAAITTVLWLAILGISVPAEQRASMRVEPAAPVGLGGALIVSIEPALCTQADLLLRLMRRDIQGGATWNVFETPVGEPCRWVIQDLWPGKYDVAVQRGSSGYARQILADRTFDITVGTTVAESLYSSRTEIAGLVTIDGAMAFDLQGLPMVFSADDPNAHAEIAIDERGEYRGQLNFDGDVRLRVGGERALFLDYRKVRIKPGFNRYDIDLPPGVIKVTIVPPPELTTDYRILCRVEYEAPSTNPRQLPVSSATTSQIMMDATRTYVIIGHGYGRYIIRAGTNANNPAASKPLREVIVNLTPDQPRHDVVLDLSRVRLSPIPMKNIDVENCPAPRTIACMNGLDPR